MSDFKMPSREKYWEEFSVDEKLDKIAGVVDFLVERLGESDKAASIMGQHRHGEDGVLLVPMDPRNVGLTWGVSRLLNRKPKGAA